MKLFLANQHRFFGLIRTLVPSPEDAEDVLQETSAAMWQKFDQFELGTNFSAWGLKFARLQSLKHYNKVGRQRLQFSDSLLELLAIDAEAVSAEADDRRAALRQCVQRLPDRQREIIRLRYEADATVNSIAQKLGLTGSTVYKSLNRVHSLLLECIRRTVRSEGAHGH